MKLNNKFNLPEVFVKGAEVISSRYSKGDSDFSCTELLAPPRVRALQKEFAHEIEEDVSSRVYAIMGTVGHLYAEIAATHPDLSGKVLSESRFFGDFDGYTVSAQIDFYSKETKTISDFKFVTAWKVLKDREADPDWEAQLNIQAELMRLAGHEVSALEIIAILRDFSKPEARRNPSYPQQSVLKISIEMWPREKTQAFIKHRINLHLMAQVKLPLCTDEERWASAPKFAVMKKGGKRAVKLFDTESEAHKYAKEIAGGYVENRPGKAARCELYCSASQHCSQYQAEIGNIENAT